MSSPLKRTKISKNYLETFCCSDGDNCTTPLGISFLYIPWLPENSCFATRIMRNVFFCSSRPPILVSTYQKSIPKSSVSRAPSWTPLLIILRWFYLKIIDLGTPSKSIGRQNGTPNQPSAVKKLKKNISRTSLLGVLEPSLFPNRFGLKLLWFFVDLRSIYGRFVIVFFAIWSDLLMDLSLCCGPFFNKFLQIIFLKFRADKQGSDKKSAKICQDLPKAGKIKRDPPNDRQA